MDIDNLFLKGEELTHPWYAYCCYWQGDQKTCKPRGILKKTKN